MAEGIFGKVAIKLLAAHPIVNVANLVRLNPASKRTVAEFV